MSTIIFIGVCVIVLLGIYFYMRDAGVFKGDSYGTKSTISIGDKPKTEENDQATK
jgi:hypothetical protein